MLKLAFVMLVWGLCSGSSFMMSVVMCVLSVMVMSLTMNGGLIYSGMVFELDKLSLLLVFLCMWVGLLMVVVSGDVKLNSKNYKVFFFIMVLLNITLVFTFSVNDFILFFVLFEVTMIPTLSLIVGWGYQPERMKAMFYMLIYTMVSSLPLLLLLLSGKVEGASSYFFSEGSGLGGSAGVFYFLVLSMLVKLPVYCLHLWLPKAHVEAPLAGSIVLAAILLKLGGYGILRLMSVYPKLFVFNSDKLMMLGLVGAGMSSIICTRQVDVKSLIAYSSIAHMGVMLASLSSMSSLGLQGAFLMLVSHGLSSSFLFYLAFLNYGIFGSRSSILSSGLLKFYPSMALMWFLGCLMGLGVPPSINFAAEVNINCSVVLSGVLCGVVLSVSLFVGAIYSLYLYTSCSHGLMMNYGKIIFGAKLENLVNGLMHIFPGFMLVLNMDFFNL